MFRVTSFLFIFVLCCLYSCSTEHSDDLLVNSDTASIDLRDDGPDPSDCCDFTYDVNVTMEGDCCVFAVSIWVDYARCPIYVIGPNGLEPSGAKAYYYFTYSSCENPGLEQANFQVLYEDEVAQITRVCSVITLDLSC